MTTTHTPQSGDIIRVQGNREYLPVAARVQWFRGDHPDWTLDTSVIELDFAAGYAVMRAEVRDDTGRIIGAGTKTETRKGFGDFVEKAETGAVGRALARAGYGTEDALDLEGERYADAPIEQPERAGGRTPSGGASPADRSAPAPRSSEEEALLDRILSEPGMTHARMTLMADAVGVKKGEHATAEQLREMIARFIESAEPSVPTEEEGRAGSSDQPAPDNAAPGSSVPDAATPAGGALPPGSAPPAASPTDAEILAAAGPGAELVPPKPGSAEYKRLANGTERARAKAYWDERQKNATPAQESLAEALGNPVESDQ